MSITLDIPQEVESRLQALTPQERESLLAEALTGYFLMEKTLQRREKSHSRLQAAQKRAHEMTKEGVSREEAFSSLRKVLGRIDQ